MPKAPTERPSTVMKVAAALPPPWIRGADARLLDGEATLAALGSKGLTRSHGQIPGRDSHVIRLYPFGPVSPGHRTYSAQSTTIQIKERVPYVGPAPHALSFQAQPLQQLIDVGERHQHLARFRTLVAADDAMLGKLVDDPAGSRIADVELALDQ